MTTTPDDPNLEAEVGPGDVAENPTKPSEDGAEPSADPGENPDAHTAEDAEDDPPLDADEGDPSVEDYPAES